MQLLKALKQLLPQRARPQIRSRLRAFSLPVKRVCIFAASLTVVSDLEYEERQWMINVDDLANIFSLSLGAVILAFIGVLILYSKKTKSEISLVIENIDKNKLPSVPNWVQTLFNIISPKDRSLNLIGDLFEEYRQVYNESGKTAADIYLREQIVESIKDLVYSRLIFTKAIKWFHNKILALKQSGAPVSVRHSLTSLAFRRYTLRLALSLIVCSLIAVFVVWHQSSRDELNDQLTLNELLEPESSKVIPEKPMDPPPIADNSGQPSSELKNKRQRNSTLLNSVVIILKPLSELRDMHQSDPKEQKHSIHRRGQTYFVLNVPKGTSPGIYNIAILDPNWNRVFSVERQTWKRKTLKLSFDTRSLSKQEYFIAVSREDGAPIYYSFRLNKR